MVPYQDLLKGSKRMQILPSGEVVFNKLKITRSSIQEGDTHFILQFDLVERDYGGSEVLVSSTYSTPIEVFSHSSQIKRSEISNLPCFLPAPQIIEVIPSFGKPGDRVVIIGRNFYPNQLVQFGGVLLQSEFNGEGTLICNVPVNISDLFGSPESYTEILSNTPEDSGVEVRIVDNGNLSQSHGTFHYLDSSL
jgi:hypothetical protein